MAEQTYERGGNYADIREVWRGQWGGQKGTQSHAWLVLVNTVTVTTDNSDADRKYKSLISVYNEDNDVMLLRKYYNLKDSIIIDITGDQFTNQKCFLYYNIPVYVGFLDDFHKLFRVDQCSIHEPARLWDARCKSLYRAITKYIKWFAVWNEVFFN